MNRSLLDYSTREILFRLFQKLGLKTRSEAHFSHVDHEPLFDGLGPLLVSGVPRSGTTTILHEYARALNYNALFEPLVFNHLDFDVNYFQRVAASFRANPEPNELALQEVVSGVFSYISGMTSASTRALVTDVLRQHLLNLTKIAGHNVVIKELRWMGNLEEVDTILSIDGQEPRHLLIDPDPYMVLYTHYRLGGLSEQNDFCNMAVNQMYDRRLRIANNLTELKDVVVYSVRNKWEKLLLSVLIDRCLMMQFSERHPTRTVFDTFENLMNEKRDTLNRLGFDMSKYSDKSSRAVKHSNRHLQDRYFRKHLESKVSDEVHLLIERHSLFQRPGRKLSKSTFGFKRWFTKLSVDICEI